MTTPAGPTACEACGELLERQLGRGRRRRFCDARCRSLGRRQREARRSDDPSRQPFARAVHAAVDGNGRSLRTLAKELNDAGYDLSASTLSQWRGGRTQPYPTEDLRHRLFVLERLTAAPPGSLVRALLESGGRASGPGDPRPRPVPGRSRRSDVDLARQRILRRIAELDGSDNTALLQVRQQEHYVVGDQRHPRRSETTLTVRTLRSGLDRYWHVFAYDPIAPMTLEAGAGCTRQVVLDDLPPVRMGAGVELQVVAVRLRFDEPVPLDAPHTFSFTMCYPPEPRSVSEPVVRPLPQPAFQRIVTSPVTREVELRISFDPHTRLQPRQLWQARWAPHPAGAPPVERTPVGIDEDGHGAPLLVADPQPGGYGYVWDWPNDKEGLP